MHIIVVSKKWLIQSRDNDENYGWEFCDECKSEGHARATLKILRELKDGYLYRAVERTTVETVKEW